MNQIAYDIGLEDVVDSDFRKSFSSFVENHNCFIGNSEVEDNHPALFIRAFS